MWIDDECCEAVERALNGNPVTQDAIGVGEAPGFDELVSGVVAVAGIGQGSWVRTAWALPSELDMFEANYFLGTGPDLVQPGWRDK